MGKLGRIRDSVIVRYQSARFAKRRQVYARDLSFQEAADAFPDRNQLYAYMHHYFHHLLPPPLRVHRDYFSREQRGFGEAAFHAMWFLLLREFRPLHALEIGVYRGQVLTLWGVIAQIVGFDCQVHGISPFSSARDQVSAYSDQIDYLSDTLESNRRFALPPPILIRTLSAEAPAVAHLRSRRWDLIYIDGGHDYEVALADYELCSANLNAGGLLVMDDSSLGTNFCPPRFSFAGHPGPSRIVKERALKELHFLGGVGHNNVFQAN